MTTKEVSVQAAELAALMDDLDSMLASAAPAPAPAPVEAAAPEPVKVAAPAMTVVPPGPVTTDTVKVEPPVEAAPPWEEETPPVIEPEPATPEIDEAPAEEIIVPDTPVAPPAAPVAPPVIYSAPVGSNKGLTHYIDVPQFQRDTAVGESNLDEAMMQQAGMRAFYGAQAAYAEGQAARTKAKFDLIEARLYDEHRKLLVAAGEKATDKAIEAAVKMDPRWFQAKNAVIEAETIAQVNKGLTFALADRRDMLIQLGADRREEFKGQTRIVQREGEKASLTERALAVGRAGIQRH